MKNSLSHPVLKNAPKEGDYVNKLDVKNYRPLGVKVCNVRCARCGQKGHASGDRECPLADVNPNDAARKRAEDPASMMQLAGGMVYKDNLRIKDHIRKEHQGDDQDLLPDESEESDPEKAFLDSLSLKQKKRLFKALKKKEKKEKKKKDKEKNKDKSKEKRKRRRSSESDSNTNDRLEHKHKKVRSSKSKKRDSKED